jgi:hypothetical protein
MHSAATAISGMSIYYIACSRHLAAGYVDQPPLSIFILSVSIKLFGDSIFAIRFLPALASGVTVFLAGLITRKMKGNSFAVVLACLSVAIAPEFLGSNGIYSMNAFDWVFWSLAAYVVVLIVEADNSGKRTNWLWLLLGAIIGMNPLSLPVWLAGVYFLFIRREGKDFRLKGKIVVLARNYGEAGAIDFFRDKYPLPGVICGHNNYWYWGPRDTLFTSVIGIGGSREDYLKACDSVNQVAVIENRYAMPYENNLPVFICSQFKISILDAWESVKVFI